MLRKTKSTMKLQSLLSQMFWQDITEPFLHMVKHRQVKNLGITKQLM